MTKAQPKYIYYEKEHDILRLVMPDPVSPYALDTKETFPGVYVSKMEHIMEVIIFDCSIRSKRELSLLVPSVDWKNVSTRLLKQEKEGVIHG